MDYQQAADIRKKGIFSLITDKLVSGQGIGSSIGSTISEKTQATVKGFKQKIDPLNIVKALTFGSNIGPALFGRLRGRKKEDIAFFAGGKNKLKKMVPSALSNEQSVELLGLIYKELVKLEEERELEDQQKEKEKNDEIEAEDKRNQQIIDALSGKKVKLGKITKPKVKKEKKLKEKEEPAKPPIEKKAAAGPVSKIISAAGKAAKAVTSITKVGPGTAILGTAAVLGGVYGTSLFSKAAMATIKSEQGVRSEADALSPNNDKKRVQRGEFPDLETPKLGAATPDTRGSTSYGLFGISNIRNNGKSPMDIFVEQNPQFNLPSPGDPKNPQQVKEFNQAWWNLAKTNPKELLEAQARYFRKTIEEPAISKLKNLPAELANNPGVQEYMIDRYAQFGNTMFQSAMNYASEAKTPQEFINLISEHDRTNLRQIFKSTSDTEFKKLEKGLLKRIDDRTNNALNTIIEKTNVPVSNPSTGSTIDSQSKENKDLKATTVNPPTKTNEKIVNTTSISTSSQPVPVSEPEDDRSAYEIKVKQK